MQRNKELIKTIDIEGNVLELIVLHPTHKIAQEANLQYNLKVSSLIRNSSKTGERLLLRSEINNYLVTAGIWTKEDAIEMENLGLKIRACEFKLKQGGIKLSEARELAITMGEFRNRMLVLYNKRQQLDSATVESVAENHKFNFLVSKCSVVPNSELPYFSDLNDYLERSDQQASVDCAKAMAKILYGFDDSLSSNLFEVKWLKEAGFVDDRGRYINRDKKLVDRNGRLIDEEGRFINNDGEFIDINGIKVDGNGNLFVTETHPFIDDNTGQEIPITLKDSGA